MKTQPINLAELSPEAASVITKLTKFAETQAELLAEFTTYIKGNRHLFTGQMFDCDYRLDTFNESAIDYIANTLAFIQNLIGASYLKIN